MQRKHLFPLVALLLCTFALTACDPNIRSVGRGVETGAVEFKREFADMRAKGEISPETADKFAISLDEIEATAHDMTLLVNWESMSKSEKRRTVLIYIDHFILSAVRLDEAGVLGFKSARARNRVEQFKTDFRRGLSALRVIEASLPPEGEKAVAR